MTTAVNISVNIPQMSGTQTISISELKTKVQAFVNSLFVNTDAEETKGTIAYSEKISRLRAMSRDAIITEQDIKEDDRLSYLLSK